MEAANQPGAQPRQGDVGVSLIEADLDVPPAHPPASGDVFGVIAAGEQLRNPLAEGSLEPVDLSLATRDDFARVGMTRDLVIEVVDEAWDVLGQQRRRCEDAVGVLIRPAHVGLELAISLEELLWAHGSASQP